VNALLIGAIRGISTSVRQATALSRQRHTHDALGPLPCRATFQFHSTILFTARTKYSRSLARHRPLHPSRRVILSNLPGSQPSHSFEQTFLLGRRWWLGELQQEHVRALVLQLFVRWYTSYCNLACTPQAIPHVSCGQRVGIRSSPSYCVRRKRPCNIACPPMIGF
jgi:hypothetical protein